LFDNHLLPVVPAVMCGFDVYNRFTKTPNLSRS